MPTNTPTPFINPTNFPAARFGSIPTILNLVVPLLSMGAAVLFIAMLMYAGFTIITAGGEEEKVEKAKKIGTYSAAGLLLVVFAYLLVKIISIVLNVQSTFL